MENAVDKRFFVFQAALFSVDNVKVKEAPRKVTWKRKREAIYYGASTSYSGLFYQRVVVSGKNFNSWLAWLASN